MRWLGIGIIIHNFDAVGVPSLELQPRRGAPVPACRGPRIASARGSQPCGITTIAPKLAAKSQSAIGLRRFSTSSMNGRGSEGGASFIAAASANSGWRHPVHTTIPAEGLGDRLGEEISGNARGVQQRRSSKLVDWSALSSRGSDWSQEFDVKTTQNGVKMTQNASKNRILPASS